jgi:signal transduction histidine kinase
VEATLDHRTVDAARCRRVAQTLGLDAVGVVRSDAGERSLAWWSAPGSPTLPLDVDAIIDGRIDGWLVVPSDGAVVVGRLTERSTSTAVVALRTLLLDAASAGDGLGSSHPERLDAERARWAFAIHDGLTQIVTSAVLDLEWRARQLERDPADSAQVLMEAAAELRTSLEEIRAILAVVTPQGADHDAATLEEIVRRLAERWHVPASWSLDGDLGRVPASVLEAASSVIRESVVNAAKHSSTRRIAVHVAARPTEMEVSVEDTGRGFRPQEAGASGHLGLAMMRRRVEELHGTLDIQSEPGRGTRVVARLPVGEGETP